MKFSFQVPKISRLWCSALFLAILACDVGFSFTVESCLRVASAKFSECGDGCKQKHELDPENFNLGACNWGCGATYQGEVFRCKTIYQ